VLDYPRVFSSYLSAGNKVEIINGGTTVWTATFQPKGECKYTPVRCDFVNKYGKKHGLKVGKTNLSSSGSKDVLAAEVYGKGETYKNLPSEQKRKIDAMYVAQGNEVHYFDLTPEAKESFLSKGQPMFAAAPLVAADEETRREMLEKLFNSQ